LKTASRPGSPAAESAGRTAHSGKRGSSRERQKAARRAAMLQAAARLFAQKSYARTTFEEIAAAAGFGVATVYKYFPSKERIVIALLQPDWDRMAVRAQRVIRQPPGDPADAMVRLISTFGELGGHHWASRELLRLVIFPGVGNDGVLTSWVIDSDRRAQQLIRTLLRKQQDCGALAPQVALEDATAVIFGLLNQNFAQFLTHRELRFRSMFQRLSRQVRLVFDNWRR
jgi:AcrR family transcriptional regulator